jgi:hypothetical protein
MTSVRPWAIHLAHAFAKRVNSCLRRWAQGFNTGPVCHRQKINASIVTQNSALGGTGGTGGGGLGGGIYNLGSLLAGPTTVVSGNFASTSSPRIHPQGNKICRSGFPRALFRE